MPGRTDNEIKNYWNTRVKRMRRAGLSPYPDYISQQVLNNSEENPNVDTLMNGTNQHSKPSQEDLFDIPDIDINYDPSRGYQPYGSSILDIPEGGLIEQIAGSLDSNNVRLRAMYPPKRLRDSDIFYNGGFVDYSAKPLRQLSSPCDPILNSNDQFHDQFHGSHAFLNGITSSSAPMSEAMKLELPSLQYLETQNDSWGDLVSPLPSMESINTMIQSSPTEQYQSCSVSRENSGLLEDILHEFKLPRGLNNASMWQTPDNCIPNKVIKSSNLKTSETEWEWQGGDSTSSLGHSSGSVLTDYTPPLSMCSVDETHIVELTKGHDMNHEAVSQGPPTNHISFTRPDALLDQCWFFNETRNEDLLKDARQGIEDDDGADNSGTRMGFEKDTYDI
ncbi:transcription factor GAMYB-like [Senna tora]|uniref:Transcription factor GAMYB-like n=1 Tax=Senna tora TaxID=362788 RepID=A0A835CAY0_9FABA|nr:transcription factor GAMYB-like [Senna tora]